MHSALHIPNGSHMHVLLMSGLRVPYPLNMFGTLHKEIFGGTRAAVYQTPWRAINAYVHVAAS